MVKQIAFVVNDQNVFEVLAEELKERGFSSTYHSSKEAAIRGFAECKYDVIVAAPYPTDTGIIHRARSSANRDTPIVILDVLLPRETRESLLKEGAAGYVTVNEIERDPNAFYDLLERLVRKE